MEDKGRKARGEGRDDACSEIFRREERHCCPDNEGKKTELATRGGVIKQ